MLIKLLPEQASNVWEDIKEALEAALPPITGKQGTRMSNLLTSILLGDLTVWICVEEGVIHGMVITTFTCDIYSGTRTLLIYAIYGYGTARSETWKDGMRTFLKFAKANNCQTIGAYTNENNVIEIARSLGGNVENHYLTWNVE